MVNNFATCRSRRGATIIEVMFAIFVAIVGLMGIASLLPLASRNASDSNAFNIALTQGKAWVGDFYARRFIEPQSYTRNNTGFNWQWYNDFDNSGAGFYGVGFVNFARVYDDPPLTSSITFSPTNSGVTSASVSRLWCHQAVCLDPVFMSSGDVSRMIASGAPRAAAYRPSLFPYYDDGHNPLTDAFGPTLAWHDQPRMIRVTLGLDDDTSATSLRIANKLVNEIFASRDDITGSPNQDDSTDPTRRFFKADGFGTIGKGTNTGDYTWMATIVPEELRPSNFIDSTSANASVNAPTRDYTVTVMVYRKRDKTFLVSNQAPGATENKPGGERLVWVYPLSGNFIGGNGGRVRLVSDANSENSVHVGDWIMLGKHYLIDPTAVTHRYSRFHWYRVVAVDSAERIDLLEGSPADPARPPIVPTATDPYGNAGTQPVWARDVVLEGPDWDFTDNIGGIPTPTTGTLMENVVTVLESKVTIER